MIINKSNFNPNIIEDIHNILNNMQDQFKNILDNDLYINIGDNIKVGLTNGETTNTLLFLINEENNNYFIWITESIDDPYNMIITSSYTLIYNLNNSEDKSKFENKLKECICLLINEIYISF